MECKAYNNVSRPAGIKYKFGIQVPKGINNEIDIDKKNGNQLWQEPIQRA
jgi:hypothetical protein